MTLYLDMDGVLADFDSAIDALFPHEHASLSPLTHGSVGRWRNRESREMWHRVDDDPNFFFNLLPMPDMQELWDYTSHHNPVILTGVPTENFDGIREQKERWIAKHLGASVRVIATQSRAKNFHCEEGDVLVDDWEKYRHLWEESGGIFVVHTSARNTIEQLRRLGL